MPRGPGGWGGGGGGGGGWGLLGLDCFCFCFFISFLTFLMKVLTGTGETLRSNRRGRAFLVPLFLTHLLTHLFKIILYVFNLCGCRLGGFQFFLGPGFSGLHPFVTTLPLLS